MGSCSAYSVFDIHEGDTIERKKLYCMHDLHHRGLHETKLPDGSVHGWAEKVVKRAICTCIWVDDRQKWTPAWGETGSWRSLDVMDPMCPDHGAKTDA